jgi:hypothetical protein
MSADARSAALRGIAAAASVGNSEVALDLHLLIAAIDEGAGDLEAALTRLEEARPLLDATAAPVLALRVYAARIRVRRLLGEQFDAERAELSEQASALLTPSVLRDVRSRPALLRELVAELGSTNFELLREGLEVVGLEFTDDTTKTQLLRALISWDKETHVFGVSPAFRSDSRASSAAAVDWSGLVHSLGGATGITRLLLQTLILAPAPPAVLDSLAEVFRAAVWASVSRKRPQK